MITEREKLSNCNVHLSLDHPHTGLTATQNHWIIKKKKQFKNIYSLKRGKVFYTIYDCILSQFLNLLYAPGASRKVNKPEALVIEAALTSGQEQNRQESIVCLCLFPHPPHLSQTGLNRWEAQIQRSCWGRTTANGCTQQACTSANWSPACWVGGC